MIQNSVFLFSSVFPTVIFMTVVCQCAPQKSDMLPHLFFRLCPCLGVESAVGDAVPRPRKAREEKKRKRNGRLASRCARSRVGFMSSSLTRRRVGPKNRLKTVQNGIQKKQQKPLKFTDRLSAPAANTKATHDPKIPEMENCGDAAIFQAKFSMMKSLRQNCCLISSLVPMAFS